MIKNTLIGAALLLAPAPLLAQVEAAAAQASDPARISAARPVVDKLWPLGTYRRLMSGSMSKLMDGMMASLFDMPAADLVGTADPSGKTAKAVGDKTMGEITEAADPHFRERFKITMDVMMGEMIPLMEKVEPSIRDSLVSIYAARFTTAQLDDMNAFFATPSGKAYADQSMMIFMDPEMMKNMQAFVPEFIKAMPALMQKVEKATAHLPPPPKKPKTR